MASHCFSQELLERQREHLRFNPGCEPIPPKVSIEVTPATRIGNVERIGPMTNIGPDVKIGRGSIIGNRVLIDSDVTIGNFVTLAHGTPVGTGSHLEDGAKTLDGSSLGSNVWLGEGSTINYSLALPDNHEVVAGKHLMEI